MSEMTQRQRIDAVLHRKKPDKVPFTPYDEFAPMDDEFIRSMVGRGMGRWTFHTRVADSERPNVRIETQTQNNINRTFYHTPVGTVSDSPLREGMIKSIDGYDPVIFLIEDEVFSPNYAEYEEEAIRLGESGFVRVQGIAAPYSAAYGYFGMGWDEGFKRYIYHQQDHPDHFAELLKALERRNERLFQIVADCPAEVICIGSVDEHYGPGQYEEYILPFYEKYVHRITVLLEEYVEAQIRHGRIKPVDVPLIVRGIQGMFVGLLFFRILGDQVVYDGWDKAPELLAKVILEGLGV